MKRLVIAACGLASAMAFADAVDDLKAGKDIDLDMKYVSYTYNGILSGSGSGEVLDAEAPPAAMAKDPNTLNIILDSGALGFPFNITIPMTGTKLSSNKVRWTTDTSPNECITVDLNGTPVNLLIKRVWGQLSASAMNVPPFYDTVTLQPYNVRLDDTGGDAENWVNIEAYLFCSENFLNRVDFRIRSWDYVSYGGVARGFIAPTSYQIIFGVLQSGDLGSLALSDDNRMSIQNGMPFLITQSPITVEFRATAPTNVLSLLAYHLESHVSIANITQRMDLYDYTNSTWVQLDQRPASVGVDAVVAISVTSNVANFVKPGDREVASRARYKDDTPAFLANWNALIDQVAFEVQP